MISKKNLLRFTWDEWKWIAIIVMLGVVMYWTALVIEPTYQLLDEANQTQQQIKNRATTATMQNQFIIENQNNNTQRLEELLRQHNQIETTQSLLIQNISKQTQTLEKISKVLLIQQHQVNQTLVDILIEKEMRQWIAELKQNLSRNDNDT